MALAVALFTHGTVSALFFPMIVLAIASCIYGDRKPDLGMGLWMVAIFVSCFMLAPVNGYMNAPFILIFLLFPLIGQTASDKALLPVFVLLLLYCAVLIGQQFMPDILFDHKRSAWPLLDPNSAAQVITFVSIPALYVAMHTRRGVDVLIFLFTFAAMICTGSKSGLMGLCVAALYMIGRSYPRYRMPAVCVAALAVAAVVSVEPLRIALSERVPIWHTIAPFIDHTGMGLGTFFKHYAGIRIEDYTAGFFAHNDLLQIAFEMGWPIALIFLGVIIYAIVTSGTMMGAVFLSIFAQSLVNYPFYFPAVSLLMGIAFANRNNPAFQILTLPEKIQGHVRGARRGKIMDSGPHTSGNGCRA